MSKKIQVSIIITVMVLIGILVVYKPVINTFGGGVSEPSCSVSSTEVVTIGDDISSTVLAANGTRAYARIQFLNNTNVNTASFSFDEGAAAVVNEGASLASTTKESILEFGRNTDFPYTGAVTGITDIATTTALVTECSY